MCILSGCDYLESIKGIGLKKAYKLVHEHGDDIGAILRRIRRDGKFIIPIDYERNFEMAMLTFKFQVVFCPEKRELINLNDPDTHPLGPLLINHNDHNFLGDRNLEKDLALKICTGEINPLTRECYKENIEVEGIYGGTQKMKVYSKYNNNGSQKSQKYSQKYAKKSKKGMNTSLNNYFSTKYNDGLNKKNKKDGVAGLLD